MYSNVWAKSSCAKLAHLNGTARAAVSETISNNTENIEKTHLTLSLDHPGLAKLSQQPASSAKVQRSGEHELVGTHKKWVEIGLYLPFFVNFITKFLVFRNLGIKCVMKESSIPSNKSGVFIFFFVLVKLLWFGNIICVFFSHFKSCLVTPFLTGTLIPSMILTGYLSQQWTNVFISTGNIWRLQNIFHVVSTTILNQLQTRLKAKPPVLGT